MTVPSKRRRRAPGQRIADRLARTARAPRERAYRQQVGDDEHATACRFWRRVGAQRMPAIVDAPGR